MPSFSAPEPVELGFVDASDGNLHLNIPLGSYSQRGTSQPEAISLEYDSNVWEIYNDGTEEYWAPNNGPSWNDFGGWYISNLLSTDPNTWNMSPTTCVSDLDWLDQNGTTHYFHLNSSWTYPTGGPSCPSEADSFATDSSGYHMYLWSSGIVKVYAPDGTLTYEYPSTEDPQGHYIFSEDSNGNYLSQNWYNGPSALYDTLGREIVSLASASEPQTLTISTSQGQAQYQLLYVSISVKTNFQQSNVEDVNTGMTVLRSITLPDAARSTYYFTYDCDETNNANPAGACSSSGGQSGYYGTLTGITLPTGGTISYGYQNFADVYGNESRWVQSHSSANGSWTYQPNLVSSTCNSTQYWTQGSNSCEQKTTVTSPTGQTIYTFGLNNGAWPITVVQEDLSSNVLSTVTNTWDTSHSCVSTDCTGNQFVRLLSQQTMIASSSGSLTKQTKYTYDTYDSPYTDNVTALQEWRYVQSGSSFPPVPDRATYTSYLYYTGWNGSTDTGSNNINRPLSVQVCGSSGSGPACSGGGYQISQTQYTYDVYGSSGLTSITGIANHDDSGFGLGYTTRGNPTSVSQWVSGSNYLMTSYTYDTTGQVLTVTDPATNITTYHYNDNFFTDGGNGTTPSAFTPSKPTNAYTTSVTDAVGTQTIGYYWGSGKMALTTDYNNVSAYNHFQDGLDRQTEESDPISWSLATYLSATQSDTYTAVVTGTSPSSGCSSCQHTETILDEWGRTSSQFLVNNPIGPVEVDSSYDADGRLGTQSHPYSGSGDPNHVFEITGYDVLDRQTSVTHPDSESQQVAYGPNITTLGGLSTQQGTASTYGLGYPQVSEDESGHLTEQWLDGFGRIIEVDEPGSSGTLTSPSVTNYLYDAAGNLTQVSQGGQTRTFQYDGLGRRIYENTPEGGTVTYSFLKAGGGLCSGDSSNVCYRTDARNVVSTYTYNTANQLTGIAYTIPTGQNIASMPNSCTTSNGTSANVCYTYGTASNSIGRLAKMVDPTGSETYTYDAGGRVTNLAKVINGQTFNLGYQYDADGDITQITYPSGRVVQQAYNAIGQLCEIAASASGCSDSTYYAGRFSYNAAGKLTGFTYGNGVTGTFLYSPDRTQLTYLAYAKGNSTYFNLQYSYRTGSQYSPPCPSGTTGNNGSIQCILDNVNTGRTVDYSYDPLKRMATAKTCGSSQFPQWGISETYDRFGNRWTQSVTVGSGPTQSLAFGTNGINGSTTNRPNGYTFDPSGNMTVEPTAPQQGYMTFDGENRMTAFSGGGAASYTYDGNGFRVIKSVTGGATTVSIFSGSLVIAEYDNGAVTNSPTREYIQGASGLLAMFSAGDTTYYHQDHLSVRFTTDGTSGSPTYGQVLTQQGTFPFGESWYSNLGPGENWVFTSYDRDQESGLDYALARYYDSRTGTFCSADPLAGDPSDPQSWNRYPYGRNDPIGITDPSGKNWFESLIHDVLDAAAMMAGGPFGPLMVMAMNDGQFQPFGPLDLSGVPIGASWNGSTINMPNPGLRGALGLPTMADVGGPTSNLTAQGRVTCPPWTVTLTGVGPKQAHNKSPITHRRSGSGDAAIDPRDFGESDWYQQGKVATNSRNPLKMRKAAFDTLSQEADDISSAQIQITPEWGTATDPLGSKLPSANGLPSGFPTSGPMSGNDVYSPAKYAHNHIDSYGWLTTRLAAGSTRRVRVDVSLIPTGSVRCPH